MLITITLATAFVVVGICLMVYIVCVHCYSVVTGKDIDYTKFDSRLFVGACLMLIIFLLTVVSLVVDFIRHLIS